MYWVRTLEGQPWKGAWALPLCWGQEPTSGPHTSCVQQLLSDQADEHPRVRSKQAVEAVLSCAQ